MSPVKNRNLLILFHLLLASFLAPAFLMVAVTGAMDLAGLEAEVTETPIDIPLTANIDPDSLTIDSDIKSILSVQNIDIEFDSLRVRPDTITTRPTSRSFVRFKKSDDVWGANLVKPGLQYRMMELHKGHGPQIFKAYQITAGIALFFVILGGLAVGLMAKAYRRKTILAFTIGTVAFLILGLGF